MSVNLANICPAILTGMGANAINNPLNVNSHVGSLGALNSPLTTRRGYEIEQANNNGTGQKKTVRVAAKQRLIAADTVETKDCDPGEEIPYFEETIEISQYRGVKSVMNEETLRTFCVEYANLVQITGVSLPGEIVSKGRDMAEARASLSVVRELFDNFLASEDALIQAINIDLLTAMDAAFGTYVGGATSKTFQVEKAEGGIDPNGFFQFKQEILKLGYNGPPILIGDAGAMQRIWMNDSRYFGQGADGINYETMRNNPGAADFYYDQNLAATLSGANANSAVVFIPGSLIYLPFIQYTGNYGKIGNMWRMSMPFSKIPTVNMDVRILPDECEENYAVWMECFFELFAAPANMWKTGDFLEGTNGVLKASFTQGS